MTNKNTKQLGYFINLALWEDALKLLEFQIQQKQSNRHFNTLSMFYYEKLDLKCLNDTAEEYFNIKISTSLFYGLTKEFAVYSYVIPKPGLGLRDCKFLTYPMRVLFYTVGLYLLKLSQQFLKETKKRTYNIESFYGGKLIYEGQKLKLNKNDIYYLKYYKKFQSQIKDETKSELANKVILKLDIENYFNELSVPKLLDFLTKYIKPSVQNNLKFDIFTKEQIICFFEFITNSKSGIPQGDNNIISGFIGYLYLVFADLFIDDLLKKNKNIIDSHKIIRYVDDIYISIVFKKDIDEKNQSRFIHSIAYQIAEILYSKLTLKLNLKTRLFHLSKKEEKEEFLKFIRKKPSEIDEYLDVIEQKKDEDRNTKQHTETPQEKLEKIFAELRKIKKSKVEDYLVRDNSVQKDILQNIFDKNVEQILDKKENKKKIRPIFKDFNYDLIKVQPMEILIILLENEESTKEFTKFCLEKKIITTADADLIVKFLCQTGFEDKDLLDKLQENQQMKDIIDTFLKTNVKCDQPGYYDLSCMQIKKLSKMSHVVEQTRLRVLSEKSRSYSVAINHLVNEIQAVCEKLDEKETKNYYVDNVINFLQSKDIQHEICIGIRNLFDLRNFNSISHPGIDGISTLEVTETEYLKHYKQVGKCLDILLTII